MNKVNLPLRIFQQFKYKDFVAISGVGPKTANLLTDMIEFRIVKNYKDIQFLIKLHNLETNNKIRYNFINNNVIKMKDGNVFELFYLK
jgi:hypothetical protein